MGFEPLELVLALELAFALGTRSRLGTRFRPVTRSRPLGRPSAALATPLLAAIDCGGQCKN